jgi:two-component system sensor histidine kinase UhpB
MTRHAAIPTLAERLRRRAIVLALAVLLAAAAAGGLRMHADIDEEMAAAAALARHWQVLAHLASDDEEARRQLTALDTSPRHLRVQVVDAAGRSVVGADAAADAATTVASWPLPRAEGAPWQMHLHLRDADERAEALASLADQMGFLLLCAAGLLLAQHLSLGHALRPWRSMLAAIGRLEAGDTSALRALPTMPVRELEATAGALRHLADALDAEQARRRVLAQQLAGLQEDERQRLAADLHDEFGQRLTALRMDAHWLARQELPAAVAGVLRGIDTHVSALQGDLRDWLRRLQPFGAAPTTAAALAAALRALVQGYGSGTAPHTGLHVELDLHTLEQPTAAEWPLEQSIALAVYRMSQEALTNAARHAQASRVQLSVAFEPATGAPRRVVWRVADDGKGLADPAAAAQRGTGLAGLRDRAWAAGAELRIGPACDDALAPGLALSATLELQGAGRVGSTAQHPGVTS